MRHLFVYLIILFISQNIVSQNHYPVDSIEESLFENANAIVRNYNADFTIIDRGNASLRVYLAITILNKAGEEQGVLSEFYHKFKIINNVRGWIYDKSGYLLRELKRSDIQDVSPISDFILYEDNRLKYCKPVADFYPYTVVYEYDVQYKGLFYYPTWQAVPDFNVSAEKATFTISSPSDLDYKHKQQNIPDDPVIENTRKETIYSWNIKNVQALPEEPLSYDFSELVPSIYLAPAEFEIMGYAGYMKTWSDFGAWVSQLNQGKDELTNRNAIKKVNELKAEASDSVDLVRKIYEYMQSRTRYVNIKLGIGGYQPFEADLVHEVGYGDCKALSIYTKALLKEAGINSYYTLVKAGESKPDIMLDFPSPQFNHAFLCVPLQNDTVWLECTHQNIPFGYISDFTHNRHVLLITPDGGEIAKTPKYNVNSNVQVQVSNVVIDNNGSADLTVKSELTGLQYDLIREPVHQTPESQKKWIYDNLKIPSFEVTRFSFSETRGFIPSGELNLQIGIEGFASKSNKRIFIPVNPLNKLEYAPKEQERRRFDVVIHFPYTDYDTVTYQLPDENYTKEYCPDNQKIDNEFGFFEITFLCDEANGIIQFTRHLIINDGIFPAEKYNQLASFLSRVKDIDNSKMVFIRK